MFKTQLIIQKINSKKKRSKLSFKEKRKNSQILKKCEKRKNNFQFFKFKFNLKLKKKYLIYILSLVFFFFSKVNIKFMSNMYKNPKFMNNTILLKQETSQ